MWIDQIAYYENDDKTRVPIIPQSMVKAILRSVHNSPAGGGHFGEVKTIAKVRLLGWWPNLVKDVKNWVKSCDACQRYKIRTDSTVAPMRNIVHSRVGEIWAADIAMLPLSTLGNRYLLVISEYLTKWTVTIALPSYDTNHIAQALLYEVVLKFGVPLKLITDNAASLISEAMTQLCARLGIKRSLTSVEHPQTDGVVERLNRTLKISLAAAVSTEPTQWNSYLQFITFAYNTAVHSTTGFSPFQMMLGRKPVLPNEEGLFLQEVKTYETETWVNYLNKYIPLLHGKAIKNMKVAQGYQKTFYDKGRRVKYDYKESDLVLRRNLTKGSFPKELWYGPFVVVGKNNKEGTFWKLIKQDDPHLHVTTANVRQMRPYFPEQGLQLRQQVRDEAGVASSLSKGGIM